MEKTGKYLLLSIGMSAGAYVPVIFGASTLGGWSILGSLFGGAAAIVAIYKLDN